MIIKQHEETFASDKYVHYLNSSDGFRDMYYTKTHQMSPLTMYSLLYDMASQVVPVVRNPPANAGDSRDMSSKPGSGRSPGGENGNQLQYSCLENAMNRGDWWATVHGPQSQTQQQVCLMSTSCYSTIKLLFVCLFVLKKKLRKKLY